MRYRTLGRTNLQVSEVGFGGIPIQTASRSQAVAVIQRALDLGINFVDTARAYTTSEERIGEAIKGRRDKCIIATKTLARTPQDAERDLHTSLSQLGTSKIELYQIHNVNSDEMLEKVIKQGVLDAFKSARQKDLIDFIGITSHRPSVLVKAVQTGEFDTIMVPLNYVERTPLLELIPIANRLNIGTMAMKPLGGGAFTNTTDAVKFLLEQPISTVLVGVRSIHELEESAALGNAPLVFDREMKVRLEEQAKILGRMFCRACDYCQPCPEGIPISALTRADTFIKRMGWHNWSTMNPNALEKYENCRQCRECESKCPYELAILDMMADKVKWLRKHYGSQISRSRKIRRLGHIKFRVRKKGSQGKHS